MQQMEFQHEYHNEIDLILNCQYVLNNFDLFFEFVE